MDKKNNNDNMKNHDDFELVMEKAGLDGPFQRMYNGIFVMGLSFCGALVYMNLILALNVPEHWCHVPGINSTNFTLSEWRTITLPNQKDNLGKEKFSSCQMFDANFSNFSAVDFQNWNSSEYETINCPRGYEYDRTWYEETIPTAENWVCDDEIYVTNTFVLSRVIELIGSFILGQMGDTFGRRAVYYFSVITVTIGRGLSILTTSSIPMFLIASSLAGFAVNSVFQAPLIIAMEISTEKKRTNIAMFQSLGWSISTTFMPLVFWWLRHWVPFMWITTLPTAIVLLFYKYMIESPRWLIGKKRFGDAIAQFKKIAKINGKEFLMTEQEMADLYKHQKEEKVLGMLSLFSQWRLAKNTVIMSLSWSVVAISYFTLVLFSTRMAGNPFLNFLLQSIVEIPAYIVGKFFGDRIGRRLTNSISFLLSGFTCIPLILLAKDESCHLIVSLLAAVIKFLNAMTFFVVSLQALEVYPTCVRQTGISLSSILANAVGVIAPYFVYLGTTYDIRYPYYILCSLFFTGGCAAIFLPETLHKKLPDTLEEAYVFGQDQKFFSLPKPIATIDEDELVTEKLNPKKYAP